jgi:hypothetical protein
MSNHSLIARVEAALLATRAGANSAKALAETVRINGRALEGMPYSKIEEMESLATDLEIASWHEQEGLLPNVASSLGKLEAWLRDLPGREAGVGCN